MRSFRKVALPLPGLAALTAEAAAQGFQFLTTLEQEWHTGANRFADRGEGLFGGFDGPELIAIGGLNRDPFLNDPAVGRIRRVYVRADSRRLGAGTQLVKLLLAEARPHFLHVRLRAVTPDAARLYETLGFRPIADSHATHILTF
jgi:GNAT superfamily N-acetyltransferase